ncbi:F-box/kelch-repeat protein At1g55270-like [Mercurialis annua]|uniref:F-box/kelch-repeat protein At1g55270-like n=1 Tax=Mercurialis annua TaxID=3986 RepID=UPI002160C097|nr:F-box/kelch-repeat protein At1g55270-like [Mercurialis annua]
MEPPQTQSSKGLSVEAPLVDSASCYCKVLSGLKKMAEARSTFDSGSKLCNAHKTKNLLPGLPDKLAFACLIRVPRDEHRKLRLVCKRWYCLLTGNLFYSQRITLGLAEEWVYVIKKHRNGKISWNVFDPVYQLWQPLPPVPEEYSEAHHFGCAVLNGCHLYLFGGKDPLKGSMNRVIFYSARTNKWQRAPNMLRKRHSFCSCVINNCLYVAGGESKGFQTTPRSAEVYDPNKNRWNFVSSMSTAMIPFIGVVHDGKWVVTGLGSNREVMNEAYDPETNSWIPSSRGLVAGLRNTPSLNGRLYALDCWDGCKLRVYDSDTNSWNKLIDSKLHLDKCHALEAAAMVPLNGKLCIVRNNMSFTLVDVSSPEEHGGTNSRLWKNIAVRFRTLDTNVFSIVHVQVLQA